jgi:hypothetical protein
MGFEQEETENRPDNVCSLRFLLFQFNAATVVRKICVPLCPSVVKKMKACA